MSKILVTGAGGFIGHHLVKRLVAEGHEVTGADLKYPEFEQTAARFFIQTDLREAKNCKNVVGGMDEIFNLAADMGGIGYITSNLAGIARNNTLINLNMLDAAKNACVPKYLYTSSACVYAHGKQTSADVTPLKEEDAYPAEPEPGYGWEKLYAEEMCKYYAHDFGMNIRVVRFHNVYGPLGTWQGGKEKSPAALMRKVATAVLRGEDFIEIWGDGEQTRSYMHISDCVTGLIRLMASDYRKPLNLGRDELVSINSLAAMICEIAGWPNLKFKHVAGPQGVRGRNSDNTRLRAVLGWEPQIDLMEGLSKTYPWIAEQVRNFGTK